MSEVGEKWAHEHVGGDVGDVISQGGTPRLYCLFDLYVGKYLLLTSLQYHLSHNDRRIYKPLSYSSYNTIQDDDVGSYLPDARDS